MFAVQVGKYIGLNNGYAAFFANNKAVARDVHEYGVELIYCSLQVHRTIFK
jgi:hypothetical protein